MRNPIFVASIAVVLLSACGQNRHSINNRATEATADTAADSREITSLVRRMLNWADASKIDLLPSLPVIKDSIPGFDLVKLDSNIKQLRETGLFAEEFISNYDKIIRTLDKKYKNHEFYTWSTGEIPPFPFASDVDPWCNCQDVPYDKPNVWDSVLVTIKTISADKAALTWTWNYPEWKDYAYNVRASKENGKWKIAYLQGFDFEESTK